MVYLINIKQDRCPGWAGCSPSTHACRVVLLLYK